MLESGECWRVKSAGEWRVLESGECWRVVRMESGESWRVLESGECWRVVGASIFRGYCGFWAMVVGKELALC